jgi:cold-inducible RNA-binding protein
MSQGNGNNRLYVGNLPFKTTDDDLSSLFAGFGNVDRASVVTDRDTGRSRGFGFVEMRTAEEAQAAITGLDGKPFEGRNLQVNVARPRERRPRRQGGGRY